jgi:hypothetical protein
MTTQNHESGPPMDLANMRRQGVQHLVGFCHEVKGAIK